ncbi:hypothetical protein ACFQY7_37815 [Actinomadura luteofluorescens]|uniref:Uncharacterized protein n=1 Tax=Actinomadura luteofluorescens TaxID=46163 RepID=A0A7Y9JHC0_9ACTN|nr:hypothetical protein [Actinomadura luteofluorescens]NYD48576.1 hypothetical protein [Actinomadura luteofluorescens]
MVKLDNYEWQSEFALTHRAEGLVNGLLLLLKARELDVPADVRGRVEGCTDSEQLERWIRRAVTADSVEDIFT